MTGTGSATTALGPAAHQVTVNLTGVSTAQHLIVNLINVTIVNGGVFTNLSVPMDILVGDVNQSRRTDSGDQTVVGNNLVSIPTPSTFRYDGELQRPYRFG